MAQEPSSGAAAQFSAYEELVAKYRAAIKRCEAQLDELAAVERQLQAYKGAMNGKATPYVFGAFDALRSELSKHSSTGLQAGPLTISDREREVFELIGRGLTTSQIAAQLSLATSTVETYRERLKQKLNLPTGNALMREAILRVAGKDPQCEPLRSGQQ